MPNSKLSKVQDMLQEMMKNHRYKKANLAREDAAKLQADLAKCRGQLEIVLKDYNRVIKTQSRNIIDGRKIGADIVVQEQMLWDAAIGYMMVKDAIYQLRSVANYDSICHANEVLDSMVKYMSGKKSKLSIPSFKFRKNRNIYGYINSEYAMEQKEELLDLFFEELKNTGDIEKCLSEPHSVDAERRAAYVDGHTSALNKGKSGNSSVKDKYSDILDSMSDDEVEGELDFNAGALSTDIHLPKE